MTIRDLPTDATPIVPADLPRRASVKDYLETLNTHAPDLDLRWDDAIALGLDTAAAIRAGDWSRWRRAALPHIDTDDLDVLALAAVSQLSPGPVPAPFSTWVALAEAARSHGRTPEDVVDRVGPYLAPAADQDGEDA